MMGKFLFLMLLFINPFTESEWNLKKEKDGIKIFTRSVEGSTFDEFKGTTTIEKSNLSEVLDIILDVKNYESLFHDCMNPKVLKQEGKYYNIHYLQVKAVGGNRKDTDSVHGGVGGGEGLFLTAAAI